MHCKYVKLLNYAECTVVVHTAVTLCTDNVHATTALLVHTAVFLHGLQYYIIVCTAICRFVALHMYTSHHVSIPYS